MALNTILFNLRLQVYIKNSFKFNILLPAQKMISTTITEKLMDPILVEEMTVTKIDKRKPNKPPFLKNIFLGLFDTDILAYPEVLDKDEIANLDNRLKKINSWFSNIEYSHNDNIPSSILNHAKKIGLFRQTVTQEMGGLQLSATEVAQIREVISLDAGLSSILTAHESLCLKTLLLFGSEEQKKKYLKNLISGDIFGTICLTEENVSDNLILETKADWNEDDNVWMLNGKKHWVVNGQKAGLFIVLAQTRVKDHKGSNLDTITAFLVDRNKSGISVNVNDTIGAKSADMCQIRFDNVVLEEETILGKLSEGARIITSILPESRINVGAECIGIVRNAIEKVVDHTINVEYLNKKSIDSEWIKQKIGKIAVGTYAMESMTYLTTGLQDLYKDQDCELESSIVKVFSTEHCLHVLNECAVMFGPKSYESSHFLNNLICDVQRHIYFNESNILLKLYIASLGIQYAGSHLNETIKKVRNPLFNPGFVIQKLLERRRHISDSPRLKLKLEHYLHPSLRAPAQWLEYCVLRLEYIIELLLARHGIDIFNKQMDLLRVANIAIDIYGMTAVLSRASRSYCIGLQQSDSEIVKAGAFCFDARERIKSAVKEIEGGGCSTNDENYNFVATKIFEQKKYYPVSPLTRNF